MSEPKFKRGQIVVLKNMKREPPFRILDVMEDEGSWFYKWNNKNYAHEGMLRALNPEEIGKS